MDKSRRQIKRAALVAGLLLLAAAVTALVLFVIPEPEEEPMPYPNGYEDLLAAGQMLWGGSPPDALEELRDYVSTNREALDRGRAGLARQCQVQPLGVSEDEQRRRTQGLVALKFLGQAFGAEGDLAARENRLGDATRCYLDVMKLGALIAHGGLMIDGLVSIAEEDQATTHLNGIVRRLDLDQCRALLTELDKIEHEQETAASILTRHKEWRTRHLLTVDGFKGYLDEVAEAKSLNPYGRTSKFFSQQFDKCLRKQTDLKAKVAARAYRLAAGSSAKSWNDLVPVYLKAVPKVNFLPSDVDK